MTPCSVITESCIIAPNSPCRDARPDSQQRTSSSSPTWPQPFNKSPRSPCSPYMKQTINGPVCIGPSKARRRSDTFLPCAAHLTLTIDMPQVLVDKETATISAQIEHFLGVHLSHMELCNLSKLRDQTYSAREFLCSLLKDISSTFCSALQSLGRRSLTDPPTQQAEDLRISPAVQDTTRSIH